MITLFSYELTYISILFLSIVGICVGMSKAGVHGAGMIAVPLLAASFGGKVSSGLMLPLLIMADVMGVAYYHKHAEFKYLWQLFPWAAIGVIVGTFTGAHMNDDLFRMIMGIIVFASLVIMIWMEKTNKEKIPNYWWFAMIMGLLAGFTTMVGNLAGSAMALFLLSMRLPKNVYIGTAAWFFLCVNIFKVPFHIWSWETITLDSFLLDLLVLPFIILGAYIGEKVIKKIPETGFRWFIIAMTAVAAVFMVV